jgi:hypothetical protein
MNKLVFGLIALFLLSNVSFGQSFEESVAIKIGSRVAAKNSEGSKSARTFTLVKGSFEMPTNADLINSYNSFANADEVDVSLVLTGNANTVVQQHVLTTLLMFVKIVWHF